MGAAEARALDVLRGTLFEDRVRVLGLVASTIDECRALADAGSPEGLVVIALGQSRGRGQRGHSWYSPPHAGLYLSTLLRPDLPVDALSALPRLAGIATCEALRELPVEAWIKEPNDIVIAHEGRWRKLGGVLVDTAVQGGTLRHAIISIGINCLALPADAPRAVRDLAVSLEELGVTAGPTAVAAAFLGRLARWREIMNAPPAEWAPGMEARHAGLVRGVRPADPVEAR